MLKKKRGGDINIARFSLKPSRRQGDFAFMFFFLHIYLIYNSRSTLAPRPPKRGAPWNHGTKTVYINITKQLLRRREMLVYFCLCFSDAIKKGGINIARFRLKPSQRLGDIALMFFFSSTFYLIYNSRSALAPWPPEGCTVELNRIYINTQRHSCLEERDGLLSQGLGTQFHRSLGRVMSTR